MLHRRFVVMLLLLLPRHRLLLLLRKGRGRRRVGVGLSVGLSVSRSLQLSRRRRSSHAIRGVEASGASGGGGEGPSTRVARGPARRAGPAASAARDGSGAARRRRRRRPASSVFCCCCPVHQRVLLLLLHLHLRQRGGGGAPRRASDAAKGRERRLENRRESRRVERRRNRGCCCPPSSSSVPRPLRAQAPSVPSHRGRHQSLQVPEGERGPPHAAAVEARRVRRGESDGPVVVAQSGVQRGAVVGASSSAAAVSGDAGTAVEGGEGVEEALLLGWSFFSLEREREKEKERREGAERKKRRRSNRCSNPLVARLFGGPFSTRPTLSPRDRASSVPRLHSRKKEDEKQRKGVFEALLIRHQSG